MTSIGHYDVYHDLNVACKRAPRNTADTKQIQRDAVMLWFDYLPRYSEVCDLCDANPAAREALHDLPGMHFMRRGLWILGGIILVLAIIGA